MSGRIDLVGKIFGFLTVQKYMHTQNRQAYWECLCVCGNIKIIRGSHLSAGKINSCGCKTNIILSNRNRKYEPHISSARKIYLTNYHDGNLIFEDFIAISQLPCHYCGLPPSNTHNRWVGKTTIKATVDKGDFVYSGLDRLDPFRPHDLDNVVPCCSICNYAKLQMSPVEFDSWLLKIASNHLFKISVDELLEAVKQYKINEGK